jgi:hypothetical protein
MSPLSIIRLYSPSIVTAIAAILVAIGKLVTVVILVAIVLSVFIHIRETWNLYGNRRRQRQRS